jgi:hypothetical protein
MTNLIFDKTDKGREEIATRKYHLASRLRTLLLLFDGKHTADDVLAKVSGLGLSAESIAELLHDGFLHALPTPEPEPAPQLFSVAASDAAIAESAAPPSESHAGRVMPTGESQFEAIYHFYTETIKSTIGLRGYALQLKVERAGSIEEFRALRQPYLEAILKAKGVEIAKGLKLRLDEVLYAGESAPQTIITGL